MKKSTKQKNSVPFSPSLEPEAITIVGAREHNLQIDLLSIPKKRFVVFTGVSGSGKSSLAFDTIYAEGQRRYVESLSAYARQFLGQMNKPHYESIRGLSPTIAIEQKTSSSNPRSTVGTITEIHDYLRVLYARLGQQYCYRCEKPVVAQTAEEIVNQILENKKDGIVQVSLLVPMVQHRKGTQLDVLEEVKQLGYQRVRINGTVYRLDDVPALSKNQKHTVEIVIDRISLLDDLDTKSRLQESVEAGLKIGQGMLLVSPTGKREQHSEYLVSDKRSCPTCKISFLELSPPMFSFNSPLGMCPSCTGLGVRMEVDVSRIVRDETLSVPDGALAIWGTRGDGLFGRILQDAADEIGMDLSSPWKKLSKKEQDYLLYGDATTSESNQKKRGEFVGLVEILRRKFEQIAKETHRGYYEKFFHEVPCRDCNGERLRKESSSVKLPTKNQGNLSIGVLCRQTIQEAMETINQLDFKEHQAWVAIELLKEIKSRLGFLINVGLEYLTLERSAGTLSGGEAQRIRLASQLGSELSGVMYVLDEPSIGLHQRDNGRLIETLKRLRDQGNTVLVVEHDDETIRAADWVVDFGPGAGRNGGKVLFSGPPLDLEKDPHSLTGAYLSQKKRIEIPQQRRKATDKLTIVGAKENNLKNIRVDIPLGVMVAVTGVSGAGKSSLINDILYPAVANHLNDSSLSVGAHEKILGLDKIDKIIAIDQQPIGRTPRSNPATYTKAFDHIRDLYAKLPLSKTYGYQPGRFSFNVKGGRCEACEGDGVKCIEMHFLADVYVPCEVCKGKRYNEATLRVAYQGKNIADLLDTSVEQAKKLFENHPALYQILVTLEDVGLGYLSLGQSAPTLSGGEAQRIKLSRELCRRDTGKTLYILDEPTTGLHFEDVRKLLLVLQRLTDAGNTVLVIEHNLDVIKCADYVIDLGPEGGQRGGQILATGTPEEVAKVSKSYTGVYLKTVLQ